MDFGTDLAIERKIIAESSLPDGVEQFTRGDETTPVTEIRISSEEGENALGKPKGRYITVEMPSFAAESELLDGRLDILASEIRSLLPVNGTVLTVGLGNRDMTADALGPLFADSVFATRHITRELCESMGFQELRSVASVSPGVLGRTGIESFEIIEGIKEKIKPSCIIVADALAALDIRRLGTTVQLSDTGISPGSGVGNRRMEISSETLGIPVIAIGVPTVISAYTVAKNILDEVLSDTDISGASAYKEYIVASREADLITKRSARLISLAVNLALQPSLTVQELAVFCS
ncbi:MAG: GPR endopeptidase [Clostridia bacterium]|nr:GPR endopeptidase [Clostridia bacterium]